MKSNTTFISDVSKKEFPIADKIAATTIRNPILALIQNDYPDFDESKFLAIEELNMYAVQGRYDYVSEALDNIDDFFKIARKVRKRAHEIINIG